MYFKEHRDSLRVSILFFYFATTRTPVEIFLLPNDSCRYVPAHVFRSRANKFSALYTSAAPSYLYTDCDSRTGTIGLCPNTPLIRSISGRIQN